MLRAKIFTLMVMLFAFSSNSFADGLITPKKSTQHSDYRETVQLLMDN